jgi:1-aminocyclopropane-1-carboxylate deaminase/D-cysteine desulfhydrase-like pyridoxal-dependent ACC family enzyme
VERLVAEGVALANAAATRIGLDEQFAAADIAIDGNFIGSGYGLPTEEGLAAIRLLARTEAVFLDPVYSGKAMAALISHVQTRELEPDDAVIFLHTGGGPSLFPFETALL